MYERGIRGRASCVAVVIVGVDVDASLIPLNGLLGLHRRRVFVWAGPVINLLHSMSLGKRRGRGVRHCIALTLKASLSVRYFPLLAPSRLSHFSLLLETVITQAWLWSWAFMFCSIPCHMN